MAIEQNGKPPIPPVKAAARPSEHVSATDQRAEAKREPEHAEARRQRRQRGPAVVADDFDFPLDQIPPHLDYQWKRFSVYGEENPFYMAKMRAQGWEPVPASRHLNLLPPGYNAPHIIRGGMMLMDTPKEFVEEARAEMYSAANRQVVTAEQRLGVTPKGELSRDLVTPRVVKEVGRMIIED